MSSAECRKLLYLDKRIDFYSEIILLSLPNADAITRRLKKLINIIFKLSNDQEDETCHNDSLKELLAAFSVEDRINFIEYVKNQGVPYSRENQKFSFDDLRSRLNLHSEVTIDQIQEFFNMTNLLAFIVLTQPQVEPALRSTYYDENLNQLLQLFSVETAEEYLRNNNLLYYWRHVFDTSIIE